MNEDGFWQGPEDFDCGTCKWDTNEKEACLSPRKDELGALKWHDDGLDGNGAPCPAWEPRDKTQEKPFQADLFEGISA